MDPHPSLPQEFGDWYGHRRLWRQVTTQEISLRVNHRRRKVACALACSRPSRSRWSCTPSSGPCRPPRARSSSSPASSSARRRTPYRVILGEAPGLGDAPLPPPSIDQTAHFLATSSHFAPSAYLPSCSGVRVDSGSNGNLDPSTLCVLWDGTHYLRADAAVALAELNHRFALRFGRNLCLSSAYRSIGDQAAVKANRGYLAARPGQSPHGWGIAIDLCYTDYRGQFGEWFKANAGAYGFIHPHWAETSLWEPWHWEYGYEHANGSASTNDANLDVPPDVADVPDVTVVTTTTTTTAPSPSPST